MLSSGRGERPYLPRRLKVWWRGDTKKAAPGVESGGRSLPLRQLILRKNEREQVSETLVSNDRRQRTMKTCKSCGFVHGSIVSCPKCGALTTSGLVVCLLTPVVCLALVVWLVLHPRTVNQTSTAESAPPTSPIAYAWHGWGALTEWVHHEGFSLVRPVIVIAMLSVLRGISKAIDTWKISWVPVQFSKLPSRKVFDFLLRCVLAYIVYLSLLLPFVRPSKESEVWRLGILFALVVGYAWTRLRGGREA